MPCPAPSDGDDARVCAPVVDLGLQLAGEAEDGAWAGTKLAQASLRYRDGVIANGDCASVPARADAVVAHSNVQRGDGLGAAHAEELPAQRRVVVEVEHAGGRRGHGTGGGRRGHRQRGGRRRRGSRSTGGIDSWRGFVGVVAAFT